MLQLRSSSQSTCASPSSPVSVRSPHMSNTSACRDTSLKYSAHLPLSFSFTWISATAAILTLPPSSISDSFNGGHLIVPILDIDRVLRLVDDRAAAYFLPGRRHVV